VYIRLTRTTGNVPTLTINCQYGDSPIPILTKPYLPRPLHLEKNRSESLQGGSQIICSLLQDADVWNPSLCRVHGDASMRKVSSLYITRTIISCVYLIFMAIKYSLVYDNFNYKLSTIIFKPITEIYILSLAKIIFITFIINGVSLIFLCFFLYILILKWNFRWILLQNLFLYLLFVFSYRIKYNFFNNHIYLTHKCNESLFLSSLFFFSSSLSNLK